MRREACGISCSASSHSGCLQDENQWCVILMAQLSRDRKSGIWHCSWSFCRGVTSLTCIGLETSLSPRFLLAKTAEAVFMRNFYCPCCRKAAYCSFLKICLTNYKSWLWCWSCSCAVDSNLQWPYQRRVGFFSISSGIEDARSQDTETKSPSVQVWFRTRI